MVGQVVGDVLQGVSAEGSARGVAGRCSSAAWEGHGGGVKVGQISVR